MPTPIKLSSVSCQYGAPMGRSEYGRAEACLDSTVFLFKVSIDSGGYDSGGAYWGVGGPQLYCAADGAGNYRRFVRADSRQEAMGKLGLKCNQLKSKAGIIHSR